jgi:hypothetical protein
MGNRCAVNMCLWIQRSETHESCPKENYKFHMKHWEKITNHRRKKKKKTDGRIFMALIPVNPNTGST